MAKKVLDDDDDFDGDDEQGDDVGSLKRKKKNLHSLTFDPNLLMLHWAFSFQSSFCTGFRPIWSTAQKDGQ